MASTDNVYATVLSYQAIAMDETKHSFIMKDKTMIQFLAYCLDCSEIQIVETALSSFEKLIENEDNHKKLRAVYGIIEALKCTSERLELPNNLTEKASNLYICLHSNAPAFSTRSRCNLKLNKDSMEGTKFRFETKLSTFHIHGLSVSTRQDLEKALIKVKGVVSVVVDVQHQRCVVRSLPSLTPEDIANAVTACTSMDVKLVVRNANNQEVLQDILKGVEGDVSLPPYLPEENSPVRDKAILSLNDLRNNASNWISAATSFFQTSFYW